MPQEENKPWQIANFPVSLRNKFVGIAKMQGKSMPALLANIVRRYIYEYEHGKDTGGQ